MTAMSAPDPGPRAALSQLLDRLRSGRRYEIGFPGATDLRFDELAPLLTGELLNNVGDPWEDGHGLSHTKDIERRVVHLVADLLRAPAQRWGYVTGGSTEATLHTMAVARRRYPDLVVYTSTAAHYSVPKAAGLLQVPLVLVDARPTGHLDLDALGRALAVNGSRPALVVATAGTTMSEAVDDVAGITRICDGLGIDRRWVHVDAALSGIPLALLPEAVRPPIDFAAGATSIGVSGHKFLGTGTPCGIVLHAEHPDPAGTEVSYIGSCDTTLTGSRSGHTPLLLWWALTSLGIEGHRRRAEASRQLASYAQDRLRQAGWTATRNPHAFTVVIEGVPDCVADKWHLARDADKAHIICMPGVEWDQVDEFLADLDAARKGLLHGARPHCRVLPHPVPASPSKAGAACPRGAVCA